MNRLVFLVPAGALLFGCNEPSARLNAPPHGEPYAVREMQGTYTYMSDNALLADMTVSDIHFLPHRPTLSPLGEERVSRLAALIDAYGGTIRFNTNETDTAVIEQRTDAIRKYLATTGLQTTSELVQSDMPGGRGMAAGEVILIKTHEGTYRPKANVTQSTGSSTPGTPPK